jgi:hypothetical protein
MATKPELNIAVAYAKNKASEYNENFDRLLNYIEAVSEELNLKVNTINSQLSSSVLSNLQSVYPIGSLYIGVNDTCPIANLFGTWEKVAEGLCLQGATSSQVVGETVEAGLPDHTHAPLYVGGSNADDGDPGAYVLTAPGFYNGIQNNKYGYTGNVSNNSVYGKSNTVQPPAYLVNVWKRTA